jgi:hypothetical protein
MEPQPSQISLLKQGENMETENIKTPDMEDEIGFAAQFMELACDYLSVEKRGTGFYEFSSLASAQSPTQKVKVSYDAITLLDPEKKRILFWEKMVERSSGIKAGFFSEKYVQKGKEVSKEISGHLLLGGKYGFEYGKLRDVIKAMATIKGWKFKTAIFKPKFKDMGRD